MYKLKVEMKLIYVFLFILLVGLSYIPFGTKSNIALQSLFLLIGTFSLWNLWTERNNRFNLNSIFYIFNLFFFSIAPMLQYKYQICFYGVAAIDDVNFLHSSVIILSSNLLYFVFYFVFKKFNIVLFSDRPINNNVSFLSLFIISLISVFVYLFLINFKFYFLINRGFQSGLKGQVLYGSIGYSILLIIRYIPFVVLIRAKFQQINFKLLIPLLLLCLIVLFPTALSRGVLGVVYLPLVLLFFPIFQKNKYFTLLFLIALILVFPLFNLFRENIYQLNFSNFQLFTTGHFDAYQNLTLLLKNNVVTYGRQLIGSILFFKHQTPWFGEINGTGHLLATMENYEYTNVAMPFLGEGFANFGYVGIIIFMIVLAFINTRVDFEKLNTLNFEKYILTLVLIGWEFYLLRGDLMSSFKMFSSLIFAILIVKYGLLLIIQFKKLKV